MEKTLSMGAFTELSENDRCALFGEKALLPLGGIIFRCNIFYSDTAFRDACIWGAGSAGGAAVTGVGILGSAAAGAVGFSTSTASSINNGTAHFDYGLNF